MFCKRCGKYNSDTKEKCAYCGGELTSNASYSALASKRQKSQSCYGESKTIVGVLMCLFLSLVGLIIGLLLYPANTYERESFLKGWTKTFIVTIILSIVLVIILFVLAEKMLAGLYY